MTAPFTVAIPDAAGKPQGRTFVSTSEPTTGPLPPMAECCKHGTPDQPCTCKGDHTADDASRMRFLTNLWTRAREGKRSDHARLRMIEKLYRGVHYEDQSNYKKLEVTNFCYANVETVAGIFNKARSMPRLEPTKPMDANRAKSIRELANWWQNRQRTWMTRSLGNRIKAKSGYTILLLTIDPQSGMPSVSNWSPWDWYPDPSAKDIPGCEYFVFAAPIPTTRLRAMFPKKAHLIKPDSYVSPAWEVNARINEQMYQDQWIRNYMLPSITNEAATAPTRSNPQPSGSTQLSPERVAYTRRGSETTFFFQFVVRDRTLQNWTTAGNVNFPSPVEGDEEAIAYPDTYQSQSPACPSGWRSFFACASVFLDEAPVDECYGGLPFVADYYVRHEGRIEGIGEIEPIAPIQRSYNERKNMLNRSLRISAAPVLRSDKGSGINYSRRTVEAGDVLEPNKGSNIEWLEYAGPHTQQFEHLATERKDMEIVSGVHEALQGIRPEGIETGIAIRELQGASATRIQAKMPEGLIAWAEVITKAIKIMRAKLQAPIMFKASDGTFLTVSREDLDGEYSFNFPSDENDLDAEAKIREEALTLFQLQIIDRTEVLERIGYPNWKNVALRMEQMDLLKAKVEAEAKAQAAAGGKGPPGKGAGNAAEPAPAAA